MNKSGKYLVWTVLSVMGAFALGYIALNRGEQINALWIVVASVCIYLIAYRFYGLYIAKNVLAVDPTRMTPAVRHNDGLDYVPTDKKVLFGHHFAAIAGAGPLVGPVLAAQMGYLPGMIWLLAGVVLAGAVQDFMVLFVSTRRDGRSLGELVKEEMGPTAGVIALVACFMIMVIILAVLAMIVVKALTHSPWGTYTVAFTIPLAIFMGIYLRYLRPGRIGEVSVIGLVFLIFAIISGGWVAESPTWAPYFDFTGVQLTWMLVGYGFVAAVLPVWLLLAPRDYLSTFLKIGTIVGLAVGILIMRPTLTMPALTKFVDGTGPVWTGNLFPVPVYHHRLWCGVWLPCADLFRHHAEDAGERRAGVLYRLRWDVDGILRGDYGAGFCLYHRSGRVFCHEQPNGGAGSGRDGGCSRFCRAGGE